MSRGQQRARRELSAACQYIGAGGGEELLLGEILFEASNPSFSRAMARRPASAPSRCVEPVRLHSRGWRSATRRKARQPRSSWSAAARRQSRAAPQCCVIAALRHGREPRRSPPRTVAWPRLARGDAAATSAAICVRRTCSPARQSRRRGSSAEASAAVLPLTTSAIASRLRVRQCGRAPASHRPAAAPRTCAIGAMASTA